MRTGTVAGGEPTAERQGVPYLNDGRPYSPSRTRPWL
ncbi:hypothetical protein 2.43 [Burkholderia phage Bups phi1]|nr:hypothetical protein 2.43 [Burkholderia phage Bups phi1]